MASAGLAVRRSNYPGPVLDYRVKIGKGEMPFEKILMNNCIRFEAESTTFEYEKDDGTMGHFRPDYMIRGQGIRRGFVEITTDMKKKQEKRRGMMKTHPDVNIIFLHYRLQDGIHNFDAYNGIPMPNDEPNFRFSSEDTHPFFEYVKHWGIEH